MGLPSLTASHIKTYCEWWTMLISTHGSVGGRHVHNASDLCSYTEG